MSYYKTIHEAESYIKGHFHGFKTVRNSLIRDLVYYGVRDHEIIFSLWAEYHQGEHVYSVSFGNSSRLTQAEICKLVVELIKGEPCPMKTSSICGHMSINHNISHENTRRAIYTLRSAGLIQKCMQDNTGSNFYKATI